MYYTEQEVLEFKKFDGSLKEFNSILEERKKNINPLEIVIKEICNHMGINEAEATANTRKRDVVFPRQVLHWAAYYYTKATLSDIGFRIGKKSHSNVKHGIKAINNDIDVNVGMAIKMLNIDNLLSEKGLSKYGERSPRDKFK